MAVKDVMCLRVTDMERLEEVVGEGSTLVGARIMLIQWHPSFFPLLME